MSKREIIKAHIEYFNSLPTNYKPEPKPPLPERKKAKEIVLDPIDLDYKGEDFNLRPSGFLRNERFDMKQLDFVNPTKINRLYTNISKFTGGNELPDECRKPIEQFIKLGDKYSHFKNPLRSIEKQMFNKKKTQIIQKKIVLDFK